MRADDTGVSGMPADRPTATPAEGLGNQPDANAPEPKGGCLWPCCHMQHRQTQPADLHVEASGLRIRGLLSGVAAVLMACQLPAPLCALLSVSGLLCVKLASDVRQTS